MLRTQQVVDGFDGIERFDRHFDKHRIPVTHGTVPQAGQLKRLKLTSVFALLRDKSRIPVYEIRQVVFRSVGAFQGANKIDRIKVRSLLEELTGFGFFHVDL